MSQKWKLHPDQYTDHLSELYTAKCSVDKTLSSYELYGDCLRSWVAKAIVDNNVGDARFLLKAGFHLDFLHLNLASMHHWLANDAKRSQMATLLLEHDHRIAFPAYAYCKIPDTGHCLTHWPPRGCLRQPPATTGLPAHADIAVLEYWERMGKLRRVEARANVRGNWNILRGWLVMRSIVFWLMGVTQERLCAPGGKGRREDSLNYSLQFAS